MFHSSFYYSFLIKIDHFCCFTSVQCSQKCHRYVCVYVLPPESGLTRREFWNVTPVVHLAGVHFTVTQKSQMLRFKMEKCVFLLSNSLSLLYKCVTIDENCSGFKSFSLFQIRQVTDKEQTGIDDKVFDFFLYDSWVTRKRKCIRNLLSITKFFKCVKTLKCQVWTKFQVKWLETSEKGLTRDMCLIELLKNMNFTSPKRHPLPIISLHTIFTTKQFDVIWIWHIIQEIFLSFSSFKRLILVCVCVLWFHNN